MKFIKEIIQRRLEVSKDLDLNGDNLKSIWTFYEIYKICLNFLGIKDNALYKKHKLIKNLMSNRDDFNVLNKLKTNISQDTIVIEEVLNSLEEEEELNEVFEDFYPMNIIGINLYDR